MENRFQIPRVAKSSYKRYVEDYLQAPKTALLTGSRLQHRISKFKAPIINTVILFFFLRLKILVVFIMPAQVSAYTLKHLVLYPLRWKCMTNPTMKNIYIKRMLVSQNTYLWFFGSLTVMEPEGTSSCGWKDWDMLLPRSDLTDVQTPSSRTEWNLAGPFCAINNI